MVNSGQFRLPSEEHGHKTSYGVALLDFPNVFRPNWIQKLIKF